MARAKKRKAKRERAHKEPIIREVARILDTGTPTKWRWWSEARHGLRQGFCLQGMAWHAADERADEIMQYARHRIGLQWPSWTEAHGAPPVERVFHFCATCGGWDADGHERPWCSYECGQAIRNHHYGHARRWDDAKRRQAVNVILSGGKEDVRSERTERRCRHCDTLFTPNNRTGDKRQKYCSNVCALRADRKTEYRDCLVCGEAFKPPRSERMVYCSIKCRNVAIAAKLREQRAAARIWHHKPCGVCGTPFPLKKRNQLYCGAAACMGIVKAASRARELANRKEKRRARHAAAAPMAMAA
jgi:hypothetical protein